MLNKTNTDKTNESTENCTQKIFSDKQTIEQLNFTQQVVVSKNFSQQPESIQSIKYHSVRMYKETIKIGRNLKQNNPNITVALKTIRNYINEILEETRQIEEILDYIPNSTNAPKTNTSFTEITLEQAKQIFEKTSRNRAIKNPFSLNTN